MVDIIPSSSPNGTAYAIPEVQQGSKGEPGLFRLRQGDWRAVYRIDRRAGELRVLVIEPRREETYR